MKYMKNRKTDKRLYIKKTKNKNMGKKLQAKKIKNKKTDKKLYIIILISTLAVMLILLRFSGKTEKDDIGMMVGDFGVIEQGIDKKEELSKESRRITFEGLGEYKISEKTPSMKLKNPERNFVDMVFTLTDKGTGGLIARTDKIPAGKYVHINVMDFYKHKGVYNIKINISTYDPKTGSAMNSMEQEVRVTIN